LELKSYYNRLRASICYVVENLQEKLKNERADINRKLNDSASSPSNTEEIKELSKDLKGAKSSLKTATDEWDSAKKDENTVHYKCDKRMTIYLSC
jgi:hypothetical protein